METKKISFGFSKINKKLNLLATKENAKTVTKVELIKCLEGQEIKLVEEKPKEQPLIIPLKETHKTSAALASLIKRRAVLLGEEEDNTEKSLEEPSTSKINEGPEDIEKRAARELLAESQNNSFPDPASNLVLPVVKPEDLPLEGATESTLDDYESIPIQDFGKAMLRGMGWTEPLAKTSKKSGPPIDDAPMVRPKGMGLGADKALNKKTLLVAPEANEVLEIKRNAFVLILGGKYKDLYGRIEGFDDHAGRVIVKMAIGGAKEAFNEFLCQPVSKKEYSQYGKCINSNKYEEYKKKEYGFGQIILNKDLKEKGEKNIKKEYHNSFESKYQKNNSDDYERSHQKDDFKDGKKDIKRESEHYREKRHDNPRDSDYSDRRRANVKYENKLLNKDEERHRRKESSRNEYRDQRKEANSDDIRDRRKEYDDRDKKEYHRDDDCYSQRDYDRYESNSDYKRSQTSRKNDHDDDKNHTSRGYDRDRRQLKSDTYTERSDRSQYKTVELHDSSDSERDSYSSKHGKPKKANFKKKSKKSKKSKSKYKSDSSDAETTTENSSSDRDQEKYKKHKKKTKKSKKQRERSRSRGRR